MPTAVSIPSRAALGCVALAGCATAALLLPLPAAAGSYVATQCSALSPSAGQAAWAATSSHYAGRSRCGSGEGVQVFHDAESTDSGRYGAWVWRAPTGSVLTSIQANASLTNQAGHHGELWASRADGSGAVQWGGEHADFRIHSVAGEFSQFAVVLRCATAGSAGRCGRAGGDSAHAYLKGIFTRIDDRSAPSVAFEGGSLLDDAVVRGVRSVSFAAADAGSGVRTVSVRANAAELGHDARNCALAEGYATALSPCPARTSERAAVDTAGPAFRLGPDNVVRACVEDLALDGAPNRSCAERRVWVDNACPGSAAPADGVTASFAGKRAGPQGAGGHRVTTRSDRSTRLAGRLTAGGAPVGGATVCALTRIRLAGQPVVLADTARSGAEGEYVLELPPGPSREVFVHHAWGDRVVAQHGLELASEARPTLVVGPRHPARNRKRLRFTGTLPGPGCADRVVKVQARVGRHRWQVFRTDRADERCRFRARYRLRATREPTVYRFRAYVPRQEGYPYRPGHSDVARKRATPGR